MNLFTGSDAYNRASSKIEALLNTMREWKELSFSTILNNRDSWLILSSE